MLQPFVRVERRAAFICVTISLLVTLAMSLRVLPELRAGELLNPDSYMRMARLRDMLSSGKELYGVARDGSGHGTVLHWSHLIDSLLCFVALPFSFLPPEQASRAAALCFGPLNMAALGVAVAWAAAPFAERKFLWLGALLPPLSPVIIDYGMVGVVHHHVAVMVVAVACAGWTARLIAGRANADAGIALGAWAGLGIWFTPETVPLTMMAFGALWLAWIVAPRPAGKFAGKHAGTPGENPAGKPGENLSVLPKACGLAGLSFALVTMLALLVDPPAAGIAAAEVDRLSIVFAGLALAVAGAGVGLWLVHPLVSWPGARLAAGCAIGLVCCAAWLATFPVSTFRAGMLFDAAQRDTMFGDIAEMLPVDGPFQALHILLTGSCATMLAGLLAARRRSPVMAYAAVCLAVLLILGSTHIRFAAAPEAAGAIALPIALTMLGAITAGWHQIGRSFVKTATILLFVQVPFLGFMPDIAGTARAAPEIALPSCDFAGAAAMLAPHSGLVVLADVNQSPEILYRTRMLTVGSLYHRGFEGFSRLRGAWRSPPSDAVPPEIDAAGISLVLACETPARSSLVGDLERVTLLDQVRTGNPPPWLRRIDADPASGQVLYEVNRLNELDPANGLKQ